MTTLTENAQTTVAFITACLGGDPEAAHDLLTSLDTDDLHRLAYGLTGAIWAAMETLAEKGGHDRAEFTTAVLRGMGSDFAQPPP